MSNDKLKIIKNYLSLEDKGSQQIGDCPFCNKENKFYVNSETLQWDCKVCGLKGNLPVFLKLMAKEFIKNITPNKLSKLADTRKLPVKAFEGLNIGFNSHSYTLPIYNEKMGCVDIKKYQIGGRLYIGSGASVYLYQSHELLKNESLVYLCEGEWDTIALRHLLQNIGKPGIAVGTPGANTFKEEWAQFFRGKDVKIVYDNDQPGKDGAKKAAERLRPIASSVTIITWPNDIPDHYDINNLISDYGDKAYDL